MHVGQRLLHNARVRSALDGSVINDGVARYLELNSRHLETLESVQINEDTILLRSRMVQSRREIVEAEGIHLGAMAGTIDLVQRCYIGIEPRANVLTFNPRLPDELASIRTTVRYRGQTLDLEATHDSLCVSSASFTAHPITIAYRGHVREIGPGQRYEFRIVPRKEREHPAKRRDRAELQRQR